MLANKAHIQLGAYSFQIDKTVDSAYVHRFYDLQAENINITGDPGKQQLRNDTLMWSYTDWAGGEGNHIYYPDDGDVYDVGYNVNPRIRGQLTGMPTRGNAANSGSGTTNMTAANGLIWVAWGTDNLNYSTTDPETWATAGGIAWITGTISTVCGEGDWVYYADASRISRANGTTKAIVHNESLGPWASLSMLDGKLYGWTGRKLYRFDVDETYPLTVAGETVTLVYDTGINPAGTLGTSWWGQLMSCENSLLMWYATEGRTEVHEFKGDVGRPLWRVPLGFTVRASCYQNGIAYFAGHWGTTTSDNTGWGVLYGLPLDSYRPIHLKYLRKNQSSHLVPVTMCSSWGGQVMIGCKTGEIFIYDTDTNGLSELDHLNRASSSDPDGGGFDPASDQIYGMVTFGKYRYVTTSDNVYYYADDEALQRGTGLNTTNYTGGTFYFQSSKWDYSYPMEKKNLIGFHITCSPLVSGQFIDVAYKLDDAASWTNLTQITASTGGASTGRVFVPVSTGSSTSSFYQMQYKVTLTSSTSVLSPILYAITAEAGLVRKREEWELVIRLKDESSRTRILNHQVKGPTLRDWLLDNVVATGGVVTFLDGYRYENRGEYSTHTVQLKEATDVISELGEGACRVVLSALTEAS